MPIKVTKYPDSLTREMIAPCGMDCGLCHGHLRDRRACPGCNDADDAGKPNYCVVCAIKCCDELGESEPRFCFQCTKFPCARLKHLDKRYRTKYGMSMIENLQSIQDAGLDAFVAAERDRWTCPGCGGVVCVHRTACVYCGEPRR